MTQYPWPVAPLSKLADVRLGRQRSPKNHFGPQMRPYLRAANIGWNGLILEGIKEMNFTDDEMATYALRTGDLLLGEASGSPGEVGKPALWNDEFPACAFQNTLLRVRSETMEPQFLLHFFRFMALSGRFVEQSRGVGIHHLGRERLAKWPTPQPPLNEQRRIVAILEEHLSDLDDATLALSNASRRLSTLREMRVLGHLTGSGRPKQEAVGLVPAGTHDGDLARLPLGWNWARLGDVAEVAGGVTKDSKKQQDPSLPEVPYLRVANVQRGHLDLREVTAIRVPVAKAQSLFLQPGDVLLNEGGDRDKLARGWVWEGQIDGCIHQNHVFRARLTEARLDPFFLSMTTNSLGAKWAERNGKQSVNLASISLSMIRKMPVIVPAPGEAKAAVEAIRAEFDSFDRLQAEVDRSVARSATLRRALLAAAFSGRLTGHSSDTDVISEFVEEPA